MKTRNVTASIKTSAVQFSIACHPRSTLDMGLSVVIAYSFFLRVS